LTKVTFSAPLGRRSAAGVEQQRCEAGPADADKAQTVECKRRQPDEPFGLAASARVGISDGSVGVQQDRGNREEGRSGNDRIMGRASLQWQISDSEA
jgi:hypothetical protein